MQVQDQAQQSWIREGQVVKAKYLGDVDCQGTIVESRVKYGGFIGYTMVLNQEMVLPWKVYAVGDRILIEDEDIVEVLSF